MTAAQFEDLRTDEAAEVLAWRFDALCRSGFDLDAAAVLAANVEVDLHQAIELVGRGCPPALAAGIFILPSPTWYSGGPFPPWGQPAGGLR
jgi:hypothetical protein